MNNTPKIRFKGFSDVWEQRKLDDILERRIEHRQQSEEYPRLAFASGQGVIPLSERKTNNREQLTKDEFTKNYLVTELDDIVYNPANVKYGAIDRNKCGRGLISPIYVTFTTTEVSGFIERIVTSHEFQQRALRFEEGTVTKRQSVNPEDLVTLDILIAHRQEEQEKISELFDNLDNLITLYQRKSDETKELKKFMLQKMFPRDGEQFPEIRFKGFTDAWEQRKFDEWGDFYYGHSCPKWSVTEDATTPCIRYGELYTKFGAKIDKVYSYTNMPPEKLRFSKGTEVLIPRVGEDPMDYNHCTWLSLKGVAIGEMISVFNTDQNPLFSAIMFNATLQKEFAIRVEGGSITNLYFDKLRNIDISYPSLPEQKKIAAFFENIDNLITLHQRKCEELKNIKKYMLKNMFV